MPLKGNASIVWLISSVVCLAVGIVAMKALVDGMSPFLFIAVQFGASICFLWSVAFLQKNRLTLDKSLIPLLFLGFVIGMGAIFRSRTLIDFSISYQLLLISTFVL